MRIAIPLFIIVLFFFPALQAQPKKVDILEPLGTVSPMKKEIIKAKITEAFINSESYEIAICTEDAELKCITQITGEEDYFFVESRLIELESEKTLTTTNQLIANTSIIEFEKGCIQLATKLVWWSTIGATSNPSNVVNRSNGEIYNPDGIELVYVEGIDTGMMAIKGFFIGRFEITQAQWKAIMGNNLSNFTGDSLPVENVSWWDVKEFLTKLNMVTGRNYRLPTEAEWDFAATGGTAGKGYVYSGSNNINDVAWYYDNSGNSMSKKKYVNGKRMSYTESSDRRTHSVGTKQPNELGIYDMTGNVWEWCEEWYDNSQQHRVVRGGGWDNSDRRCRTSVRNPVAPSHRDASVGFRVVVSPPLAED